MIKKTFCFAAAATLVIGALTFAGCDLFSSSNTPNYTDVSTYEELVEKSKVQNPAIRLTADIDCDNATATGIFLKYLDGNGFTIKNLNMSAEYDHVAIFGDVEEIKNVTFSDISITANNPYDAAIVCKSANLLENVHVVNSTFTSKQKYGKSGILTRFYDLYAGGIAVEAQEMVNCSLENTTITVEGRDTSSTNDMKLYVGGLTATGHAIKNCHVSDCTIKVKSGDLYNIPYAGGFAAIANGAIERSYFKDNTVTVEAAHYAYTSATKIYDTSSARVGGFAASAANASVLNSYASGNTISALSSGNVYSGAFFGRAESTSVQQSYSLNNTLKGSGYINDNKEKVTRLYGGISGYHSSSTISSTFAYGNSFSETTDLEMGHEQDVMEAGMVASSSGMTMSYCAAKNSLQLKVGFVFTYPLGFSLSNCYSDGNDGSLVVDVSGTEGTHLEDAEWYGEGLKDKIKLSDDWTFADGKLPTLVFSSEQE